MSWRSLSGRGHLPQMGLYSCLSQLHAYHSYKYDNFLSATYFHNRETATLRKDIKIDTEFFILLLCLTIREARGYENDGKQKNKRAGF